MRPFSACFLALLLVASSIQGLLDPVAAAGEPKVLTWDYDLALTNPATGTVGVTITLGNVKGVIDRIFFGTQDHAYQISNVTSASSELTRQPKGWEIKVRQDTESFSFSVDVRRKGFHGTEYNAYLGPEWGVFRAEAFALPYDYYYYEGAFEWRSRVRFALPAEWRAETPWAKDGVNTYRLPGNETLPRGFIAAGVFKAHNSTKVDGREYRFVRLGNASDFEPKLFDFLAKSTPYYESVYGPAAGAHILAVSAPAPMFRGGLGAPDSFYVREGTDLRTVSHEYAHVWQLFATETLPGKSSMWFNEGDADYHGALNMFATDEWSLDQVNQWLSKAHASSRESKFADATLPYATYGGSLEDFAYHKGTIVLHALDQALLEATGGTAGGADLIQALNKQHDPRVRETDRVRAQSRIQPVSNEEILETANRLAGRDLTDFFTKYVWGTQWPALAPVVAKGTLVLSEITLDPPQARAGQEVTAYVTAVNRGLDAATKLVTVEVNGTRVGEREVTLEVGKSQRLAFPFTAPGAGTHTVSALYLDAQLRVLSPAVLTPARVSTVPTSPKAGESLNALVYVRNMGELEGVATVTLLIDGAVTGVPQTAKVGGGQTQAVSFPLTLKTPGQVNVKAVVRDETGQEAAQSIVVNVQNAATPDKGGGGFKPGGSETPPATNPTPGPGLALALAALGVCAFLVRVRKRRA